MAEPGRRGGRGSLGRAGEEAAADLYRLRGFRVLARNWRCPAGELDLVLSKGPLLVFCEVKTRSGSALGGGHEAVTARKRHKLRQLAELFMAVSGVGSQAVRFDVASVLSVPGARVDVEVFEDAF